MPRPYPAHMHTPERLARFVRSHPPARAFTLHDGVMVGIQVFDIGGSKPRVWWEWSYCPDLDAVRAVLGY